MLHECLEVALIALLFVLRGKQFVTQSKGMERVILPLLRTASLTGLPQLSELLLEFEIVNFSLVNPKDPIELVLLTRRWVRNALRLPRHYTRYHRVVLSVGRLLRKVILCSLHRMLGAARSPFRTVCDEQTGLSFKLLAG